MECRVKITLYFLKSDNVLMMIGDLFRLGISSTLEILKKCCEVIRILLRPLILQEPNIA